MSETEFPEPVVNKQKVWSAEEVGRNIKKLKAKGPRIAHCHGVFDVLHPGHIDHLEEARSMADFLIVSVTIDELVNKGPGRPVFSTELRMKMLASLQSVGAVFPSASASAVDAIGVVKPDFFVKGPDYQDLSADITGKINLERDAVSQHGGQLVFTTAPTMSSSELINRRATERIFSDFDRSRSSRSLDALG